MEQDILKYWAKTQTTDNNIRYHPLVFHSIDVAHISGILFDQGYIHIPSTKKHIDHTLIRNLIKFLGFIHDFGKFSEAFQAWDTTLFEQLNGTKPTKDPAKHQPLGWALWWAKGGLWDEFKGWVSPTDYNCWRQEKFHRILGQIAFGHHGYPIEPEKQERLILQEKFSELDFQAATKAFHWGMETFLKDYRDKVSNLGLEEIVFIKRNSWVINGLITLADWLASDNNFISWDRNCSIQDYVTHIRDKSKTAYVKEEFRNTTPSNTSSFQELFPEFSKPTPLQKWTEDIEIQEHEGGLFILEDSTGSGKTEAALTLSARLISRSRASGIYFGLPTMATSNAMFDRFWKNSSEEIAHPYKRFYETEESPTITLAHSQKRQAERLNLIEQPSGQNWLSNNRKLSLLSDIGVGTVDQALRGILPQFHHTLSLLGLNRKVLIVDEVHDYDPYTNKLLEKTIAYRSKQKLPTILLSATLSNNQLSSFVEAFYEGLGHEEPKKNLDSKAFPRASKISSNKQISHKIPSSNEQKSIQIHFESSQEEVMNFIEQQSNDGKCVAWIRNTVDDARNAHEQLNKNSECNSTLFHSRFTLGDRLSIESKIRNCFGPNSKHRDRAGKIIVGTQVMEQSLDLDFDVMITDLTPMDRVLQRAGRLHRHDRNREFNPELMIFSPSWEPEADKDWYEKSFPGASYIYKKHGLLWKTMQVLRQKKQWDIPSENRFLIEQVFQRENRENIPEALIQRDLEIEGEESAEKSMGAFNAIRYESGYGSTTGYREETPTRMGEPQTRGRLVKIIEGTPKPWNIHQSGEDSWESGDFRLPLRQFAHYPDSINDQILKKAIRNMDDIQSLESSTQNPYDTRIIIPMRKKGKNWVGEAMDDNNSLVSIIYNLEKGLRVEPKK